MNKVFVFDENLNTKFCLDELRNFGKICYVFPIGHKRKSIFSNDFSQVLGERLKELDYNPEEDYICATGSMTPVLTLILTAFSEHSTVRVLLFNSVQSAYILRTFNAIERGDV